MTDPASDLPPVSPVPSASAGPRTPSDVVAAWHRQAGDSVLLDGFHALKHAVRFGARVRLALTADRAGALALADELAGDVRDTLVELLTEVPHETYAALVPRPHPTAVAALAVRPSRADNLRRLAHTPRTAPVVVLDNPRNLGNAGAVIRLAAGFGATGVVTTGTLDPWHPTVVRGGAGLHFATAVERLTVEELPSGPVFALDPEGEDIRSLELPDDALLAFGSERSGLSAELRARADHLVALPMRPQVSSYNLATSVAMTLYHWSATSGSPSSATGGSPSGATSGATGGSPSGAPGGAPV
uniref:TrmH family RNA methyltransferase n=1 Tax=Streptomyces calvus TaxID=67282 RepID=UPI00351991E6